MDKPERDIDRIEQRLRQFSRSPIELTAAAAVCAVLSGAMPLAHKHVENGSFHSQEGFDGFSVGGFFLFLMIVAFALSFVARRRPALGVPVKYLDYASFATALIVLVRAYSFVQSYEEESTYFFFFAESSKTYVSPYIGFLFVVAAPALLWWARIIESRQLAHPSIELDGDDTQG